MTQQKNFKEGAVIVIPNPPGEITGRVYLTTDGSSLHPADVSFTTATMAAVIATGETIHPVVGEKLTAKQIRTLAGQKTRSVIVNLKKL